MSQPDTSPKESAGITYYSAASAGVAQALSLDAQNKVEEARIQSIIKATAMGNAYAKWLANPAAGDHLFKPIIDSLTSTPLPSALLHDAAFSMSPFESTINSESDVLNPYVATTLDPLGTTKKTK